MLRQTLLSTLTKLNPRVQLKNPIMFVVYVASILLSLEAVAIGLVGAPEIPGSAVLSPSGCG